VHQIRFRRSLQQEVEEKAWKGKERKGTVKGNRNGREREGRKRSGEDRKQSRNILHQNPAYAPPGANPDGQSDLAAYLHRIYFLEEFGKMYNEPS